MTYDNARAQAALKLIKNSDQFIQIALMWINASETIRFQFLKIDMSTQDIRVCNRTFILGPF